MQVPAQCNLDMPSLQFSSISMTSCCADRASKTLEQPLAQRVVPEPCPVCSMSGMMGQRRRNGLCAPHPQQHQYFCVLCNWQQGRLQLWGCEATLLHTCLSIHFGVTWGRYHICRSTSVKCSIVHVSTPAHQP